MTENARPGRKCLEHHCCCKSLHPHPSLLLHSTFLLLFCIEYNSISWTVALYRCKAILYHIQFLKFKLDDLHLYRFGDCGRNSSTEVLSPVLKLRAYLFTRELLFACYPDFPLSLNVRVMHKQSRHVGLVDRLSKIVECLGT